MKKVLLILAAVVVSSMVLSACGSAKACPAYGKAAKVSTERSV
jgi:outer membrane murein-binding lipoprotein Lpp